MIETNDKLYLDFEAVKKIPIVPLMLEVICRTTGMGFAAVARVTEDRWLACSVRDEISFGLEAGGELKIETTICNEIRDNRTAVVIDHVEKNEKFRAHHTPAMYGFQSYISFPIILKNGDFFGTLCAIDPRPAKLENPQIMGTFAMFAELLSFHLQSLNLIDRSRSALKETNRQLLYTHHENHQYKHLSNHNLKEPVRKISMFSNILLTNTDMADEKQIKKIASKINSFAEELSGMLKHVSSFSELGNDDAPFETVDLNDTLRNITEHLEPLVNETKTRLTFSDLPLVYGNATQMAQLFYHLLSHLISFARHNTDPVIRIYTNSSASAKKQQLPLANTFEYCEICIEVNSLKNYKLENIFDIFVHLNEGQAAEKYGPGLAYCRKIVHHHNGLITAKAGQGENTLITITLPAHKIKLATV